MRHHLLLLTLFFGLCASAQSLFPKPVRPPAKTWYVTNGTEWIFTFPVLDVREYGQPNDHTGGIVRFAPVFNPRGLVQYDFTDHIGFFTGLGFRNLGFIYAVPDTTVRYKYRAYTVGVPVGLKIGRMHRTLFFVGYEFELPFNYKEKRFENEKRVDRFNVWFSDRTEPFYHSMMLGMQGPAGTTITLKYYFTNFHNTEFEAEGRITSKPLRWLQCEHRLRVHRLGSFRREGASLAASKRGAHTPAPGARLVDQRSRTMWPLWACTSLKASCSRSVQA
ncbi:MAG: hypothetical protein IPK99_14365 [Flavobacteriales bacterium]|nr:hypothetical protein [Flavobacteriales bacterium]